MQSAKPARSSVISLILALCVATVLTVLAATMGWTANTQALAEPSPDTTSQTGGNEALAEPTESTSEPEQAAGENDAASQTAADGPLPAQVIYHFADRALLDSAQSFADYEDVDTVVLQEPLTVTPENITIAANRHPETITVQTDSLHFAVIEDYASTSANGAGPHDLTGEAAYDPAIGTVTLPPAYADKDLTVIFYVDRVLNDQELPLEITVDGIGAEPVTLMSTAHPLDPTVSVRLIDDRSKANQISGLALSQAGVILPSYTYANGSVCALASPLGGPLSITVNTNDELRAQLNPQAVTLNHNPVFRLLSVDQPAVGDTYTVKAGGAEILNSESNNNAADVAGWPTMHHRYGFPVHFYENSCTSANGEVNNDVVNADYQHVASGGYINGYDYNYIRGWHFAWGSCKGDVADNGAGLPEVVSGWVKVTGVDAATGTITYSFELQVKSDVDGHPQQTIVGTFQIHKDLDGSLRLEKRSANPALTTGNAVYPLAGAVYGVYSDAVCTQEVTTMTTGPQGSFVGATIDRIRAGNYWVREKSAPAGYVADPTIYPVTVAPNQTASVSCSAGAWVQDTPQSHLVDLLLNKQDADAQVRAEGDHGTQGGATLAFAQFTIDYYDGYFDTAEAAAAFGPPLRTWVFQTDESGQIHYSNATFTVGGSSYPYKVSGPELYTTAAGAPTLPLGTIVIRETKPPAGYLPSQFVAVRKITADSGAENVGAYEAPMVDETGIRGDVAVVKHDADTRAATPQGDATLANTKFEITTLSEAPVFIGGKRYTQGQVVATITTDASGRASTTGKTLPYGRYSIVEVAAPTGYRLTDGTPRTFEIRENGVTVEIDPNEAFYDQVIRGGVSIAKYDGETRKAEPQGDATLAGVTIEIVNRSARAVMVNGRSYNPGEVCATLTTDGTGVAQSAPDLLPYGAYELREVAAPQGYLLTDGAPRAFTIREDGAVVSFDADEQLYDQVIRGDVSIVKHDADTREAAPQGDAKLDQTQFAITNLSAHPVLVGGRLYNPGEVVATIITNADGVAATLNKTLPYGHYAIAEVAASVGYRLTDGAPREFSIVEDGVTVAINPDEAFYNEVIRGGVAIAKYDAETREATPQGDATLAGVTIEIVNRSLNPVVVGGKTYNPGEVVATLTTDAAGVAQSAPDLLPYGTYELRETEPPQGYNLSDTAPRTFSVREDGAVVEFAADEQLYDTVIRGGVAVQKLDRESGRNEPLGGATLAGAVFEVVNKSAQPVVVNGVVCEVDAVVLTLTTDEAGAAATEANALPYGSYEIREVEANAGYLLTDGDPRPFTIREEGVIVLPAKPDADDATQDGQWRNQVKRGDLEFQKVGANTMERLANVPFVLISQTTGERHILVTDENGYANTASEWNPHSVATNANDWLDTAIGDTTDAGGDDQSEAAPNPDADERFVNDEAGLWFGVLSDGETTPPDDELGALPYDTYRLEELPCAANAAYELVTIPDIRIKRDSVTVKLGTIDDPLGAVPVIETTARANDGGEAVFAIDDLVTFEDVVSYRGLTPHVSYHLEGSLRVKGTGEPVMVNGAPVTAALDFTPETPEGTVAMPFELDATALAGETDLVVFETLTRDGEPVADHADPDDEDQTVRFIEPTLTSVAADWTDGDKFVAADPQTTIVDTVTCDHLTVGQDYVLRSVLIVPGDDEHGPAVALFNGLTPEENDEAGHRGAAEEFLLSYWESLGIPYTDRYTNAETQMWFDLPAPAVDEQTVQLAKDSHDDLMEWVAGQRQEFRATAETMQLQSVYRDLDTRGMDGQTLRCFQMLEADGALVATETVADYVDEQVSVAAPTIGTTATDAADGDHYIEPAATVTIADTVAYTGLTPGASYDLDGILMDCRTGEPLLVDGTVVGSSLSFTPTEPDGEIVLEIPFDASAVLNRNANNATMLQTTFADGESTLATSPENGLDLVVFESLSRDGYTVAGHHDLEDRGQTVTVLSKPLTALVAAPAPSVFSKTLDAIRSWWWILPLAALGVLVAIICLRRAAGRAREARRQGATQRALLRKIERDWAAARGESPLRPQRPANAQAKRRSGAKRGRKARW